MAAYREHITVSGALGLAYWFASVSLMSFSFTQATIASILTWLSGMLPDLRAAWLELGRSLGNRNPYTLEQYGLTPAGVADRFAPYAARFADYLTPRSA